MRRMMNVQPEPESFVLKVTNDNMSESGILTGDLVVASRLGTETADGGALVIVRHGIGAGVSLARLWRWPAGQMRVELSPTACLTMRADEVTVEGRVVGLMRRY